MREGRRGRGGGGSMEGEGMEGGRGEGREGRRERGREEAIKERERKHTTVCRNVLEEYMYRPSVKLLPFQ